MTDLFISYAREDGDFVRRLHGALEERERNTWVDWDIPAITQWMPEIELAIDSADNAVFVLSPSWLASAICRKELEYATAANKRLVPLRCGPFDEAQLPIELARLNWIDFADADAFAASLATLLEALDTDLERKRMHSRLLQQARRWDESGEDTSQTLRGRELQQGEAFVGSGTTGKPLPTPLQTRFVTASRSAVTRRQRVTFLGVSVALVVATALGTAAWIQRGLAEERKKIAIARQIAAGSQLAHADDPTGLERKLLLAVESLRTVWTFEGFNAWAEPARLLPRTPVVLEHPGDVRRVKFSPDGTRLASATARSVRYWDATSGELLFETDGGARAELAISALGDWLAVPNIGRLSTWDTATGARIGGLDVERRGGIVTLAASPDGSLAAAGFHGKLIVVLDVRDDRRVAELETDSAVTALRFSPNSKRLAASLADRSVRIFGLPERSDGADLANAPQSASFAHERPVTALAFDRDGGRLATGGSCGTRGECVAPVVVWDVETGERVTSQSLDTSVVGLRFDPLRARLIAFGEGGWLAAWDLDEWGKDETHPAAQHGPRKPVVALDDRGRRVATAGYQLAAHIWDAESGAELARLAHEDDVAAVDFAPGSRKLATGTLDGKVRVWEAPTEGALLRFEHEPMGSGQHVTGVSIDRKGEFVATVGWDKATRIWRAETGEPVAHIDHANPPSLVRFAPEGGLLASAERCFSSEGCDEVGVWLLEANTGAVRARLAHASTVATLAFSPDGSLLATGTRDGAVALWHTSDGSSAWTHEFPDRRDVRAVAFSPDAARLVVAEGCPPLRRCDAALRIFDLESGELEHALHHEDGVRAVAVAPDGRSVATASSDHTLRRWDVTSGTEHWRRETTDPIDALAFTPDGRWLAAAGMAGPAGTTTGVLRVFEAADGAERYAIPHEWPVAALAVSADGRWVATATGRETRLSSDRGWRARIFDIETGEAVARLDQPDALTDIAFTPDARGLATAGWDQSAALWTWQPDDLIAAACARLQRNLSLDEWQTYFADEAYRCTCPGLPVPASLPIAEERRTVRLVAKDAELPEAVPPALPECPPD